MMSAYPWIECPEVTEPYPAKYVQASKELLARTLESMGEDVRMLAGMVAERFPEYRAEAEQFAGEIDVDPMDLLLGILSYDLMVSFGCSTMVLATDDGPMIARNMDWFPEDAIAQASCIVSTPHGKQAGFVGNIGVISGISERGFALALNAVGCSRPDIEGYPVLLFLRSVLDQATDFEHALRLLMHETIASAGIITLVGMTNDQRAIVERTSCRAEVFRPTGAEPLLVTNHFRAVEAPEGFCGRFARLCALAPCLGMNPTSEELLTVLTDEQVIQTITAQHVLMSPARDEIRLFVPRYLLGA